MTDGSLEDDLDELYAAFDDVANELDAAAMDDRRTRETEADQSTGDAAAAGDQPEREYEARLYLLVPHSPSSPRRPLDRRPDAPPPLDSAGVTVTHNGSETSTVEAGRRYAVTVAVRNGGGIDSSAVDVELFAEHLPPAATVDTNASGVLELDPTRTSSPGPGHLVTGSADLPPGSELTAVGFAGPSLRWDRMLAQGYATVSADRTFEIPTPGKPAEYITTSTPVTTDSFTYRIYDTTGMPPHTLIGGPAGSKNFVQRLRGTYATEVAEVDGRFVASPGNTKRPLDLSGVVNGVRTVGRSKVSIPASGRASVAFSYRPQTRSDERVTALYARAYSVASDDTPADWGALDHAASRFVGRTECYWPQPGMSRP